MRHFWQAFREKNSNVPLRFKKHTLILFWSPEDTRAEVIQKLFKDLSKRYPSVATKLINAKKDATKTLRHNIHELPTVVLLKDGREVERIDAKSSTILLERLFRKALM